MKGTSLYPTVMLQGVPGLLQGLTEMLQNITTIHMCMPKKGRSQRSRSFSITSSSHTPG